MPANDNPIAAPSIFPLTSPTIKPSNAPATSTTNDEQYDVGVVQTRLPVINVKVETSATDTTASLTRKEQKLMNSFWQGFVDNLVMASDLIPSSLFQSTTLDVSVESFGNNSAINATQYLSIAVNGTAYFFMDKAPEAEAFRDSLRQSLISYLSFWGTHEMEETMEQKYGLANANITSIVFDGTKIRLEDDMSGYGNVEWIEEAVDAVASLFGSNWLLMLLTVCTCASVTLC
jgi:hypothetical protein